MTASEILTANDAAFIRTATLSEAESRFRNSYLSEAAFAVYCYVWRNSAVRFSHLLENYADDEIREAFLTGGVDRAIVRACQKVSLSY